MSVKRIEREHILIFIFLLSVFLLGVIQIDDTDAWTHLSFGKWIWEHGAIPAMEPFIETSQPFPYNNWLFGFAYYLAYLMLGIPGVILLMAATITIAFSILLADSLRPYRNAAVAILVLTAIIFLVRHRFVERPDTFLMVFLPFSIFSLNAYVHDGKKYVYALPVVHLLWANSHTSIPLMTIPFLAFIGGGLVQQYLGKKGMRFSFTPSSAQIKTIAFLFIASFAASLLSPYFIGQYTHSVQAIRSDWWSQEIAELVRPTWNAFKQPHILTALVLVSFGLHWYIVFRRREKGEADYASLVHLILILPFIYLSFTAVRFMFLLGIIAAPILARNLSGSFALTGTGHSFFRKKSVLGTVAAGVLIASLVAISGIKPLADEQKMFGLGVNHFYFPEGALAYMDERGITGTVFNLFQWGGYITWRDFPSRKPFIDGRGFLDGKLLEKTQLARHRSALLDELEAKYGFDSILLNYTIDEKGTSALNYDIDQSLTHTGWALVYWDDLALLYLKKGGKYDAIIQEDAYRLVRPANIVSGAAAGLRNVEYRKHFIKELDRNISITGSSVAYNSLGFVYNEAGRYQDAIDAYGKVQRHPRQDYTPAAYAGIAYAYGQLGNVDRSLEYYLKTLELREDPTMLYKVGLVYLTKDKRKQAARYFERSLDLNRSLLSVYPLLINTYQVLGMQRKAERTTVQYQEAKQTGRAQEHFQAGLKAYYERKFEVAVSEYEKAIDANPAHPMPYSNLGYIYYDLGLVDKAYKYQRAAIEIDPNYANAHYGLALIYKKWGDGAAARRHWREYLRIEPTGYYSRKAKSEIEGMQ